MHLERLYAQSSADQKVEVRDFTIHGQNIRRWTLWPDGDNSALWFRYAALACTGSAHATELWRRLWRVEPWPAASVHFEFSLVRHAPQEIGVQQPPRIAGGWHLDASAPVRAVQPRDAHDQRPGIPFRRPHRGAQNAGWLVLGYGKSFKAGPNRENFHFDDPHHRLKRLASLIAPGAPVTNPLDFLERLHWKGARCSKPRSHHFISVLNRHLSPWLDVEPKAWLDKRFDFRSSWKALAPWRQAVGMMVLDAARHMFDAAVKQPNPFDQTGVLLLDRPQCWCPSAVLPEFFGLLSGLFPRFQFLVALPSRLRTAFPEDLATQGHSIPELLSSRPKPLARRVPAGTVVLIDVDSSVPNLALMKLSRYFKGQGKGVVLARGTTYVPGAAQVFASCVFAFPGSARRVAQLRQLYGSDLQIGGSGVDIRLRLPAEIEALPPDYTLYPGMEDRALGFLTRGCPLHCPFCIVPIKEGKPRLVSDFDSLLQGRKKLILLDDNILSHPTALALMEEMLQRDLAVNFNQTLDLRMLTPAAAALLRRIRCCNSSFTRRNYYFSLNNNRRLDLVRQRYMLLETSGRDNVEFVCMYGFDTTLAQDVERFRFLRSLPGAYVFVQRYRPVLGGPDADLSSFFGADAEQQIDRLLEVNYSQNMKSMEVYYRWLCLLYAEQRGRIHRRLVETLFRYNGRHRMGGFLAKLEARAAPARRHAR